MMGWPSDTSPFESICLKIALSSKNQSRPWTKTVSFGGILAQLCSQCPRHFLTILTILTMPVPVDQPRTLRQILHLALPDLFPLDAPPAARAIIHGITPNLDTSALWLAQSMAYPDNFLHIVVAIE